VFSIKIDNTKYIQLLKKCTSTYPTAEALLYAQAIHSMLCGSGLSYAERQNVLFIAGEAENEILEHVLHPDA